MGTRSLTVFKDDDSKEIVVMYRQFDGYPSGHGSELAKFLAPKGVGRPLVNGYNDTAVKAQAFNGMACLAAAVIAHFKKDIGGFYLYPAGTRDAGEEYVYTIYQKEPLDHAFAKTTAKVLPYVVVYSDNAEKELFNGSSEEFYAWATRKNVDDEEEG